MTGAWERMLDWEAEGRRTRPVEVDCIRPADDVEQRPAEPARISSQAGLAALRAGARIAGLTPDRENASER